MEKSKLLTWSLSSLGEDVDSFMIGEDGRPKVNLRVLQYQTDIITWDRTY